MGVFDIEFEPVLILQSGELEITVLSKMIVWVILGICLTIVRFRNDDNGVDYEKEKGLNRQYDGCGNDDGKHFEEYLHDDEADIGYYPINIRDNIF